MPASPRLSSVPAALPLLLASLALGACAEAERESEWADTGEAEWADSSRGSRATLAQRSGGAETETDAGTEESTGMVATELPCGVVDETILRLSADGNRRLVRATVEAESECGSPPIVRQWSWRFTADGAEQKTHKEVVMTYGKQAGFLMWELDTLSISCPSGEEVTEDDCCSYSLEWDVL